MNISNLGFFNRLFYFHLGHRVIFHGCQGFDLIISAPKFRSHSPPITMNNNKNTHSSIGRSSKSSSFSKASKSMVVVAPAD